ncbi:MAG: 3-deoxy-D-manno-octulosonic acid transferase [Bacteroidales bacterium]|nr:3-deoxy-D-manno-octulosonic acid transferase [Bacteroidales bacterium]
MRHLYNFSIQFYLLAVHIAAIFKPKARRWLRGRKQLYKTLSLLKSNQQPLAWFHCASLGEFEQGRPVIEAFKKHQPEYKILLTFFSPSGFEVRQNYEHADFVCYLPADTPSKAKRFVTAANPSMVIFVKYEYWHNFMHEIIQRRTPLFVLSANFRPEQYFFQWYGKRFLKNLEQVTHYFVQNQQSANLLKKNGINQVTVAGDTRFDRVMKIVNEVVLIPVIEAFVAGHHEVIIAGSSWPVDEDLLARLFHKNPAKFKLIIAPHEIHEAHLQSVEKLFPGIAIRYSQAEPADLVQKQVLIIDSIGMLSKLYRYGRYAYIGGGFGVGIHNVPEAAAYGIPVIFGPNYKRFQEAIDLIEIGGAFSINNFEQLQMVFNDFEKNSSTWQKSASACRDYVQQKAGATQKVMEFIANFKSGSLKK